MAAEHPGISRNTLCPCGSGKRFKNCHGALDGASNATLLDPLPDDPRKALELGLGHQQRGDSKQARLQFEHVLKLDPGHPDAWHLLGMLDLAQGNTQAALEKVANAISVFPAHPEFHLGHARILLALDRPRDAETAARKALALDPKQAVAWTVLGATLIAHQPTEAIDAWRQAIALDPGQAESHFLLGNALSGLGEFNAATEEFLAGLHIHPHDPQLLNNLGLSLEKLGQQGEAEACYRRAITERPTFGEAHANLGNLHFAQKRYQEAIESYNTAIELGMDVAEIWANLGIAHQKRVEREQAYRCFQRAAALKPDVANLRFNIAAICLELKRHQETLDALNAALALDPNHAEAENQLLATNLVVCRWDDVPRLVRSQLAALRGPKAAPTTPFTFLMIPCMPEDQLRAAVAWVAEKYPPTGKRPPARRRERNERLRIGYLSSDFRSHPVGNVIAEVLELHDRERVEVFAYMHGPDDASSQRERIRRAVEHWTDIRETTDAQAVRRIREDDIDVLIDLNGYTEYDRSGILAQRPAPLQIAYLGYPATLGSSAYDYLLTDRFVCPPDEQIHYTERFLYMPHSFMPSDTRRTIAEVPTRVEHSLPENGFVFCSFNNTYKIQPMMFDAWMRLLHAVPGSVLWLLTANPLAEENLRREAQRRGIDGSRLIFAIRGLDGPAHLARQRLADLFLDSLPYNAHATANDALYSGLPVLTCVGNTFAGRVAGSQLHAVRLPELVTHTLEDYESMALRLAREPDFLATLRSRLATNRDTHPLFDMRRFTGDLENTLDQAWQNHRMGQSDKTVS